MALFELTVTEETVAQSLVVRKSTIRLAEQDQIEALRYFILTLPGDMNYKINIKEIK